MARATTRERSRPMKRTRNGILIPDVPIMASGNLPNAVKGVSAGSNDWKKHAVDMGLPSGTLWADCDIDVNMPDGFCVTPYIYQKSFFSWANVDGYNPVANSFNNVYVWSEDNYNQTKGSELAENIPIGSEYDAAHVILGHLWHIPSKSQFDELIDNCLIVDENDVELSQGYYLHTENGIKIITLKSKINGKKLIFSASGIGTYVNVSNLVKSGYYWARTKGDANSFRLSFNKDKIVTDSSPRYYGLPIRPCI